MAELLCRFYLAPFGAPLADVLAAVEAVHVVYHSSAVDEKSQHLANGRFIVDTSRALGSSAGGDRLTDTDYDRCADTPDLGREILGAGFPQLPERKRARDESGQKVDDVAERRRDHLVH